MPKIQSGICPEQNTHALFLLFNRGDGDYAAVMRRTAAAIPRLLEELAQRYQESSLTGVVAIGADCWDQLYPAARPAALRPFPALQAEHRRAPATPFDLLIHLRCDRYDLLHIAGRTICQQLGSAAQLMEETHGFRYLDSRDLTGFVDGTENPQGEHRAEVAIVGEEDPAFAGGSYVHLQRYVHNLPRWNSLKVKQQEDIIGRTKADNIEYASADKPLTAHIKRTSLKDEAGHSLEILRQSMPYGTMREQGLFFIAYGKHPEPFLKMLESMVHGDGQGHYDHLLDFTQPVTGAAFFAPARDFLEAHA